MAVFEFADYQSFLKAELSRRLRRNPSYSMRAFSRALGVSSTLLTFVFAGARQLSYRSGLTIAQKLKLSADETEYFLLLIQHASSKSESGRKAILEKMRAVPRSRPVQSLDLDAFRVISDWYHFPILEMAGLPDFAPQSIPRRLGISRAEAEAALRRLIQLNLLKRHPNGRYEKTYDDGVFRADGANSALRRFHKQMLQKAIAMLETQTNSEKFIKSETFVFDPERLEDARKITRRYCAQMVDLASSSGKKPEVYHLGVQIFRLTERLQ